jgi:hypothetical protein
MIEYFQLNKCCLGAMLFLSRLKGEIGPSPMLLRNCRSANADKPGRPPKSAEPQPRIKEVEPSSDSAPLKTFPCLRDRGFCFHIDPSLANIKGIFHQKISIRISWLDLPGFPSHRLRPCAADNCSFGAHANFHHLRGWFEAHG